MKVGQGEERPKRDPATEDENGRPDDGSNDETRHDELPGHAGTSAGSVPTVATGLARNLLFILGQGYG